MTRDLHHEVELVVAIGRDGASITVDAARSHIAGYAVGIDLTRRDLQAIAKKQARPWALAKSWIGAAPIGMLHAPAEVGHPRKGRIELKVNGTVRQAGDLTEMIWSVDEIIAELSRYDRLITGDLIMTGTPAGVGPLVVGDEVDVSIAGIGNARFDIVAGV
jgi:fumarylpyruvate hydrolase